MIDPEEPENIEKGKFFKYPIQVYLILGNEICERFSYYGLHTILLLFLTSMHHLRKDISISIFHGFNVMCYTSPLFGAILSDSYVGRYKTILSLSIIYAIGSIILAFSAIPSMIEKLGLSASLVGLILISIGTGGIKPCVSTFGADQFDENNKSLIQSYFSIFYFSINLGSLISMIIVPILRSDVTCFHEDCYFLAFGLPAILMIISIILFLSGTKLYRCIIPQENIILIVFRVTYIALGKKIKRIFDSNIQKQDHWLDYSNEQFSSQTIEDVKALYRVLFIFIPIPVFWTLFDQQGSRWTIQAMEMNGNLGFLGVIKPDQIQAINPVLVMLLIPIFNIIIYPIFAMCNLLVKPISRMSTGMLFAVVSFLVAGFLQLRMQNLSSFAKLPSAGCYHLRIINLMPDTPIKIISHQYNFPNISELVSYEATPYYSYNIKSKDPIHVEFVMDDQYLTSQGYPKNLTVDSKDMDILEHLSYSFIIGLGPDTDNKSNVIYTMMKDDYIPEYEVAKIRVISVNNLQHNHNITSFEIAEQKINLTAMIPSNYLKIPYGSHAILINGVFEKIVSFKSGSIYTIVVIFDNENNKTEIRIFADVEPRPLSILWQIPQYILLTSGEVLFTITGLDFAYSMSPPSMRSFVTAAWLLTVSTGNFIVIIFEGIKITNNMAFELFIFAGLLFITTILFALMASTFVPYNPHVNTQITNQSNDETKVEEPENTFAEENK